MLWITSLLPEGLRLGVGEARDSALQANALQSRQLSAAVCSDA